MFYEKYYVQNRRLQFPNKFFLMSVTLRDGIEGDIVCLKVSCFRVRYLYIVGAICFFHRILETTTSLYPRYIVKDHKYKTKTPSNVETIV